MGPVTLAVPSTKAPAAAPSPGGPSLEWLPRKRWNPFNSNKLLAHVYRWRLIRRGRPLPPPVLITVDPTNVCNFNCAVVQRRLHPGAPAELPVRPGPAPASRLSAPLG